MKRVYFFDFVIVFVSVMLAFLTDGWRENRQDREDYESVLREIQSNLRRDSMELSTDCQGITFSLLGLSSLIDSAAYLELPRAHKLIFDVTKIRWPDFDYTGFEQLKNHRSYQEDAELIRSINAYYAWISFLIQRMEFEDINPSIQLREYLIEKGISPPPFSMTSEDSLHLQQLFSDRKFEILLKNLVWRREEQLNFYQRAKYYCELALRNFREEEGDLPVQTISLIGTGTGEKWNTEIYLEKKEGNIWEATAHLFNGLVKFRSNSSWIFNWGSTSFPKGTGSQDGPDIPVSAGEYLIRFNSESGEYSFELISRGSPGIE